LQSLLATGISFPPCKNSEYCTNNPNRYGCNKVKNGENIKWYINLENGTWNAQITIGHPNKNYRYSFMINDKKTVVNAGGVNKNTIKLSAKQFETITTNVNVSNNRIKIEPICKGKDFDQTWLHLSIAKFKRVKDTNEPVVSLPSQVKTLECDAMSGGNQCSKDSFDITDCV